VESKQYVIVGQQQSATAGQSQQVPAPPAPPAPPAIESRAQLRERIRAQVLQQVQRAEQQAAEAQRLAGHPTSQGDPVVVIPPRIPGPDMIPPQVVDISIAFFIMVAVIVVGFPIARAIARRLDRKPVPASIDAGLAAQLQRIEHTVESMSIEVERISEAQRYMARLQSGRAEPAGLPSREPTV
jgi:hypothetical protein